MLLPNEKILLNYDGIKIVATGPASYSVMPLKKVLVTNKRILISSSMFGVETLKPAMKFYYKEPKEIPHDKLFNFSFSNMNYTLRKYWVEKDSFCFEWGTKKTSLFKYKIYAPNPKKIFDLVKKNKK